MRNIFLTTAMLVAFSVPAHATKPVTDREAASGCVMKENVSVGINFNMIATSMAEAKVKYDNSMKQISDYAAELKIEKLEPQSMNYNIYAQNNGAEKNYQVSGNVQYQMTSSDMAFKFAEFLEKQKMNVNINSNSYRQGNCNQ
ncbi:MAG: hypothetical protein ACK502_05015 [Alphaproteobacteria bacterium]